MSNTRPKSIDDIPDFVSPNYTYRAKLVRIVDGDTADFMLDLGFSITVKKRLRFLLIDTYETRGEEKIKGLAAKARLMEILEDSDDVYIQTVMDAEGKYGRLLAWIWTETGGIKSNVNQVLLEEGHGTIYGT